MDGSEGHQGGLVAINLADAAHPQVAGSVFLSDAATIPWIGASLAISGSQAYVVTQGGLAAFSLSNPAQPQLVTRYPFPLQFGASLGGRVVIKDNLAYVAVYRDAADSASVSGMAIYKLAPSSAQACSSAEGLKGFVRTPAGTALGLDLQGNTAYVGDWGDGLSGVLNVVDVSNPCQPQLYANVRASGNEIGDLTVQGTSVYLANDANGLAIYDVGDAAHPARGDDRRDGSYAHAIFYNGGRYAYLGQIYSSGQELAIYDMDAFPAADPTFYAPTFAGHRDVYAVQVQVGRAYILAGDGSGNNHVQILSLADPAHPTLLGDLALPFTEYGDVGEIRVQGDYLYLATGTTATHAGGMVVIRVANPAAPQVVASFFTPDAASIPWRGAGLELVGQRVLLVGRSGLYSIDISDPLHPLAGAPYLFPADVGSALGGRVVVRDGLAYVSVYRDMSVVGSHGGLAIYKLNIPIVNGFWPRPDGYSFRNYGGVNLSDYTIEDMRADFGDAAVCVTTTPTCQPSAAALAWNQSANNALNGGHCDGMASTALRFLKGPDRPATYQLGAASTYDLLLGNARRQIARYALKQLTRPLSSYRSLSSQNLPATILSQLRTSMLNGAQDPVVLAVWKANVGGHAITPYAIEDRGEGIFWVKVYDNNYPNDTSRQVIIDTVHNTWSYDLGGSLGVWTGNATTHSMAITPISLYDTKQTCPFCTSASLQANEGSVGQVWLDGSGHLLISDAQGRRIGYANGQIVNEIPGAFQVEVIGGLGQVHAPIYTLPLTATYTLQFSGQAAGQSESAAVTQFGPGYAIAVEGLPTGTNAHSQITFAADGTQAAYQSDTPGQASLLLSHDNSGVSHQFTVADAEVLAGQVVRMQLDTVHSQVVFTGAQAGSAYNLEIMRV
ncbi:MAG: hypothetical protein HGA65_13175, partial [Oscillochloris sp.]|nr:hypothetical protein [Oscillochloris sp.]